MKTTVETAEDFIEELQKDVDIVRGKEVRFIIEREAVNSIVEMIYFRAAYLRDLDGYLEIIELLIPVDKDYGESKRPGSEGAAKMEEALRTSLKDSGLSLRRGRIDLNG